MAKNSGANLGFEERLWTAADKLRGTMDASEYKHVVLGLIFLKYISDAFQEKYDELVKEEFADPEDRDEYTAENIFWVPTEARWSFLQSKAKDPMIGQHIDKAMAAIEKENESLKGVLPKDFARPALDKSRLGQIIDLIATIGLGDKENRAKDILGRVYEYFIAKFAEKEGKGGGEFYTPQSIVRLLVEMIEPFHGRVYDPCCGSGGMFVQTVKFVEHYANGNGNGTKALRNISIYGQESNYTTWRLAKMNLAIRGIDAHIEWGDSFADDKQKDLRADFLLANPPFNMEDWGFSRVKDDVRWRYGRPPAGGVRKQKDGSTFNVDGRNANYAWIQHFIYHLSPTGTTGFVMANGSMSTNTSSEGNIRKAIVDDDLVDCMIALPGQLFYTTQIPVCLWFLTRNKKQDRRRGFRDRSGETLFIDARKMGSLIDRVHRELSDNEISEIAKTYHAWRGEEKYGKYEDKPGYCKAATLEEIQSHNYVLTPGRYVGAEEIEDDGIPFEEKMAELTDKLYEQMRQAQELDETIKKNLEALGYGE